MQSLEKKVARKNIQKKNEFTVKIIRELYRNVNGKMLSSRDRELSARDSPSLTYGEVVPQSFIQILEAVCTSQNGCFVDLGCGSGVALLTAALSSSSAHFDRVWGIEILPKLWEAACDVRTRLLDLREKALKLTSTVSIAAYHHDRRQHSSTEMFCETGPLELINEAISVCTECVHLSEFRPIEDIAAVICKRLGHKDYRKKLKGHKTFKKLLASHPDEFEINGDEVRLRYAYSAPCDDNGIVRTDQPEHSAENIGTPSAGDLGRDHNGTADADEGCDGVVSVTDCRDKEEVAEICAVMHEEVGRDGTSTGAPNGASSSKADSTILALLQTEGARDFIRGIQVPSISIERGDIFEIAWWSTADVVYCASLLFSDEMMLQLSEKVIRMKPSSVFITLKPLFAGYVDKYYVLVSDSFYKMSWQMARVYIYRVMSTISSRA